MRYFAVTEGSPPELPEPLRIIAEFIGGYDSENDECTLVSGDAMNWNEDQCHSEEELLATERGRRTLEGWRAGDDAVHEAAEREAYRINHPP